MTSAFTKKTKIWAALIFIPAALVATGCTKSSASANVQRPPEVEVIAVEQKDIPIYREWIGTLDGMVNAGDPGTSDGLSAEARLLGGILRQKRTIAVRNRSATLSGSS